jgi:mono/diheme cytochrome c family protein
LTKGKQRRWRHCLSAAFYLLVGCQQQMAVQPSPRPDRVNSFFPDGETTRPLVPGTVARGHLHWGQPVFTGTAPGEPDVRTLLAERIAAEARGNFKAASKNPELDAFPFPIDRQTLKLGQNRYMIYCIVCHDALGTGHGKIVERGYTPPPSFHTEELRKAPPGHFFTVITYGHGSMPDYRQQIPPRQRWAIAAYVKALQLSQHFPEKELPADLRARLEAAKAQGGKPQ